MFSGTFWKESFERAAKSAAQALIGLWTLDGIFNIVTVDFGLAAGVAGGAFVLSLLTSVVSAPIGQNGSPSLVETKATVVRRD